MGYQALLFCPDEKTARTVTQVLSELEFNVESCTEPFAAVKKLMGQHFDAVVVDCDNEQNATLLFKSARNSASNQASLAVAVVEGQAGVAKAFRIGANLVLTKPINIEQAKGTLRVARGLLRKGEPAKPGAPATAASAAAPGTAKSGQSVQAAKAEVPAASAAIATTSARQKTDATGAWPTSAATAATNSAAQDDDLLDIGGDDRAPKHEAPAKPAIRFITPSPDADKFLAGAVVSTEPSMKAPSNPLPATLSGGAASAPAPARERQEPRAPEVSPERPTEVEARAKRVEAVQSESRSLGGSAPTFTFGGANAPAESSGTGKRMFLGIAAAAIIAVAAYAGWAHFKGRPSEPESAQTENTTAPVSTQQATKPSGYKPSAAATTPKTTTSLPNSQTAVQTAKGHALDEFDSALDDADSSSSTRPSSGDDTTAATPLVVKGGKASTVHTKPGVADAPAPSMLEIGTAGESASPPDLGGGTEIMPKPVPQAMNILQGISRGLLTKKVQPVYPKNALAMRVEGVVELMATISKTGDITHVKVLSGDAQLAKAAAEAVKQWKYKPYLLNGEPVDIQTQVTINFKLPK
jgi:TonB family protein